MGYNISHPEIKPDPERLQALIDLPAPQTPKELKRTNGLFAYYSRCIIQFSRKPGPLLQATKFPLTDDALTSFETLKSELFKTSLSVIRDNVPFEVENDASDYAIAAILAQQGKPVAYFSRSLNSCEKHYPTVKKEATAMIEAVRKCSHFLKGRNFLLTTDQRSIAFMFDKKSKGKIKNSKLLSWRLEVSQFSYDIRHKRGNNLEKTFYRILVKKQKKFAKSVKHVQR